MRGMFSMRQVSGQSGGDAIVEACRKLAALNGAGPRIAAFLLREYARDTARGRWRSMKEIDGEIAKDFDISGRQAARWRRGEMPASAHLEAMYARWSLRFVAAAFPEPGQQLSVQAIIAESLREASMTPPTPGYAPRQFRLDADPKATRIKLFEALAAADHAAHPPRGLLRLWGFVARAFR
jgi:hypothetical protein